MAPVDGNVDPPPEHGPAGRGRPHPCGQLATGRRSDSDHEKAVRAPEMDILWTSLYGSVRLGGWEFGESHLVGTPK